MQVETPSATQKRDSISAISVAEHIRWLRHDAGEPTTPLHVVKLVYIAHGWMLGLCDRALMDQSVEAWRYGPVVPEVYHQYKDFGGDHIMVKASSMADVMDTDQREIVEATEKSYRRFTAVELSALTHEKGSPWDVVVQKHGLVNAVIPNFLIQRHYAEIASQ